MNASEGCKRTVIAGEAGCRVLYCRGCNVAELEIGSVSIRLEEGAFRALSAMLQEACLKLDERSYLSHLQALDIINRFRKSH